MKFITKIILLLTILEIIIFTVFAKPPGVPIDGNGSFSTSLICPKIRVWKNGKEKLTYKYVSITPSQIQYPEPNTFQGAGIVLNFMQELPSPNTPFYNLLDYLSSSKPRSRILPYRLLDHSFDLKNIGGLMKGEHYGLLTDLYYKGDKYQIKITLPYEQRVPYKFLSKDEMKELIRMIDQKKNDYNFFLTDSIRVLEDSAREFFSSSALLEHLGKDNSSSSMREVLLKKKALLEDSISNAEARIKELNQEKMDIDRISLEKIDKTIDYDTQINEIKDEIFSTKELVMQNTEKKEGYLKVKYALEESQQAEKNQIIDSLNSIFKLAAYPQSVIDEKMKLLGDDYEDPNFKVNLINLPI
jgi:hypothetical protein